MAPTADRLAGAGNFLLALLLVLFSINVLGGTWFLPTRSITPDSISYLRLAGVFARGDEIPFFAVVSSTWPLGYPLAIAATMVATGLDPLWASKLTNIWLFALALLLLRQAFGRDAWMYGTVFLSASVLTLGMATLSELPFIVSLLALALALRRHHRRATWGAAGLVLTAAIAAFLSRYVGLMAGGVIGLVGLWALRRGDRAGFIRMFATGAALAVFAVGYLAWNQMRAGYATGIKRVASKEPSGDLFGELIQAQAFELNPLRLAFASGDVTQMALWGIGAVLLVAAGAWLWRGRTPGGSEPVAGLPAWPFFLAVGGTYWLAIVLMRFFFHFNTFSYRLLAPSTLLLLLALIDVLRRHPRRGALVGRVVLVLALASFLLNVPTKLGRAVAIGHPTLAEERAKAAVLPTDAVILDSEPLWSYLRPDVKVMIVGGYFSRASDETLLEQICPTFPGGIYRQTPDRRAFDLVLACPDQPQPNPSSSRERRSDDIDR